MTWPQGRPARANVIRLSVVLSMHLCFRFTVFENLVNFLQDATQNTEPAVCCRKAFLTVTTQLARGDSEDSNFENTTRVEKILTSTSDYCAVFGGIGYRLACFSLLLLLLSSLFISIASIHPSS